MEALKHELKKLASLTLFFFLGFGYIILIVKLYLKDFSVDLAIFSKTLIGALVAAKTVAVLDAVLALDRFRSLPRYVNILYRTSVYTLGALIVSMIEGFIEDYRGTRALPEAMAKFVQTETFSHILATILLVAIVFFLHVIAREIDDCFGKGATARFLLARSRKSRAH